MWSMIKELFFFSVGAMILLYPGYLLGRYFIYSYVRRFIDDILFPTSVMFHVVFSYALFYLTSSTLSLFAHEFLSTTTVPLWAYYLVIALLYAYFLERITRISREVIENYYLQKQSLAVKTYIGALITGSIISLLVFIYPVFAENIFAQGFIDFHSWLQTINWLYGLLTFILSLTVIFGSFGILPRLLRFIFQSKRETVTFRGGGPFFWTYTSTTRKNRKKYKSPNDIDME